VREAGCEVSRYLFVSSEEDLSASREGEQDAERSETRKEDTEV
jgi:hypothetical protein